MAARQSAPAVSRPAQALETINVEAAAAGKAMAVKLDPAGIERNKQIQAALKNAKLYFGEVDGKIGPLTRKAIEEFQGMKGLKVDGKVGPVTWREMEPYLHAQAPSADKIVVETKSKK